jgi:uncharacterized protein (DUF305 family)
MKAAHGHESRHPRSPYVGLAWMAVLSFAAMYVLMYAMVDRVNNVYSNLNQFYMAGLMAMPMVVIELVVMRSMYSSRRLNLAILAVCIAAAVAFWFGIREQGGITERQFLKSMIPHHAGAILMCERSPIADAEIKSLCQTIIAGQQSEIDQMKAILARLQK